MYVITGATGNTGKLITQELIAKKEPVRALGRSLERLRPLTALGAEPFACEITDPASLAMAFTGADAVYAMIPPNIASPDVADYQEHACESLAAAITQARVPNAVVLSSIGADKSSGTGPVVGLHKLEQKLGRIFGCNILYLRAGYFMENLLPQAGVIHQIGAVAGPFRPDLKLPMIATRDISSAAVGELLRLDFHGHQSRELLGPRDYTMEQVARIIGKAIGQPGLKYMQAPHEQLRPAFAHMGMSADMIDALLEMSEALNSGHMRALETRSLRNTTPTTLEAFVAEEFVPIFQKQKAA
jgi:uncharacterized protein YbjT (DUF2867 family)